VSNAAEVAAFLSMSVLAGVEVRSAARDAVPAVGAVIPCSARMAGVLPKVSAAASIW
jgi:hypothetical protein